MFVYLVYFERTQILLLNYLFSLEVKLYLVVYFV